MAVQPIDWNAGGNVSLGDLYTGRRVRNEERRVDAYERMAEAQAGATEEAQRRKALAEQADWIVRSGAAILQAPPDQRPGLYGQVLEDGRARGYDVSRLPPQYDSATESYIRFNVDKVRAFQRQTGRGRGGAPAAGGGGGMALDPPYQPQGAIPPDAPAAPPAGPQPAPAAAPPGGLVPPGPVAPRRPAGAPMAPGMAPAPAPGDVTSTTFGQAPVGPGPGAMPPQAQPGGPAPSVTLRMPQMAPPPEPAGPPPSPVQPIRDDSGQDRQSPVDSAVIPPTPGIALEPGDRIVRGRGGAVRTVGGMVEVRDKDGKPQFRPMVKPQAAPRAAPMPMEDITDQDGRVIGQRDPRNGKITAIDRDAMKGGRAMTEAARTKMRELAATADALDTATGGFKDNFGGYGSAMLGNAELAFKARISGDTSGADWWRVYQAQKNIIRNDLFGAALTATEKAEFEKADIDPGLRPDVIRKNLQTRAKLTMTAVERTGRSMLAGGINAKEVEEIVGPTVWAKIKGGGAAPSGSPPAGGQPKRLKFNPATGELE